MERGDERLIRAVQALQEPTDDLRMTEGLYEIPGDREQFGNLLHDPSPRRPE